MSKKWKSTRLGKFFRYIRIQFIKLYHSADSPRQIAFGFAFGAFIGIFPTFGFGLLIVTGLGALLKFNIPSAILGSLVGMPWITPFWIAASIQVGKLITGSNATIALFAGGGFAGFLQNTLKFSWDYFVGNVVLSVGISIVLNIVVWALVVRNRRFRQEKKAGIT
jgi:uncharacterized protein (DUF2062 family)